MGLVVRFTEMDKDASLTIDHSRANRLAEQLYDSFTTSGILGNTAMPENLIPEGVGQGSLEHLLFITLTVSIDYMREANSLWRTSRHSYKDPETSYLFSPQALSETPPRQIRVDMQKYGLSKKMYKDAHIWRTVGVSFYKKWEGNPLNFLEDCGWDSPAVLKRLKTDRHIYNKKPISDYPYLRGNKIGPLWLRMLRDNVGITKLKHLDEVPIPVDVHIARASLTTGVVKGRYDGNLRDIFERIRTAWFDGVKGLRVGDRQVIALDVDQALWRLSKYGCAKRDKATGHCPSVSECEAEGFCVPGKIWINASRVELDT